MKFSADDTAAHKWLDIWLNEQLSDKSRSHVQRLTGENSCCGGHGLQ